ncbi:MAG: type II toxin-antitoxin system prevent-host-death family antitoxin [Bifidobacteriaceae bacterium]|nr:type II toxin-antitoxin system prevent-host-death family antitoxin [Bifidobacteriaceae bacterium]
MTKVGAREAKARLSELLAAARAGQDVVITRRGRPDARLAPVGPAPRRQLGFPKAPLLPDDFDEPLPPVELGLRE